MGFRGEGALLADGAPVETPRDAARDAAHEELRKAVYHQHEPGVVERFVDWVQHQISRAVDGVSTPLGGGGNAALALLIVLALVLGFVLWRRYGAPRRAARATGKLFTGPEGPRSAAGHRADAAAHAAAGAWEDAVREQMRALVRALEERTVLAPRPGRTADEAAAEAGRALPDHARELASAARLFDDIAFGDRPADERAYRLLADLDQTLGRTRPVAVPAGGGTA
ncbi:MULTISPECIES: DUF4129 domain-containing protein [Kitasatospora]|uniref:Protein-glutamine gamma-glutamyltransferase-like C-terminal domain-containing protein n=1 Tax=Kitasatospora setae (strain ATCC 33774 / DSM 43861 / JCM 3304 / KCC A-0304 / NBRC 14216 / KM-6054) TaxID=452652 RepID=E4NC02_KITSK|nr:MULTISPECIES: DUF4129 domain-containing protein [Kitasatospora]BAJ28733.1 hypothetical protein KSE_29220 [Kitasatospora setae KM-6054]